MPRAPLTGGSPVATGGTEPGPASAVPSPIPSASSAPTPESLAIGEVLAALRSEFPDMSVSKIRFLEGAGLVTPQRSTSGYRRFSATDLLRLRQVLTLQRDHYLPLKVIRAHLDAGTLAGALAEAVRAPAAPTVPGPANPPTPAAVPAAPPIPAAVPAPTAAVPAGTSARAVGPRRLLREDLLRASGLAGEVLSELENAGLLRARNGWYHPEDLAVAVAAAQLAGYGIGPRHLRGLRNAADRELGLLEQSLAPVLRRGRPDARTRAEETARTLRELYGQVYTALVTAGLRDLGIDPR